MNRKCIVLMAAAVALGLTVGVVTAAGEGGLGGKLPLFEPEGSPVYLSLISDIQPALQAPALCPIDLDGDGVMEVLAGRDYISAVALRDGRVEHWPVTVLIGIEKFVSPGMERLGIAAMASGDLDGDGLDDLVVSTWEGKLWVFLNHGRWGFQWAPGSPYEVSAVRLWVHDHDGDGLKDVIAANLEQVFFLKNSGGGKLEETKAIGGLAEGVMDGNPGVYAGYPGFFLLGLHGLWFLPEGKLEAGKVLDEGGIGLAVADFDGDGLPDVAVAGRYGAIRIYPGNEDGLGEPTVLETKLSRPVSQLLSPDLNGDGWPDLVVENMAPAEICIIYNKEGEFLEPVYQGIQIAAMSGIPPMSYGAVFGDMDGDSMDDIVVSLSLSHVTVLSADVPGRALISFPVSFILGKGDLNSDGYPDLLVSTAEGGVGALYGLGTGHFRSKLLWKGEGNHMPYLARMGDVNGDGKEELVLFEFTGGWRSGAMITVWNLENKEVLWFEPLVEEPRPLLVLSDQTGDGVPDVVTAVGNTIVIINSVPGSKRKVLSLNGEAGPLVGMPDGSVAGFSIADKARLFLLRSGKRIATEIELEIAPLDLISCDLDMDGDEDLVSIGWGANGDELSITAAVLWNYGGDNFTPQLFPIEGWPAMALPFPYGGFTAADLDGDGRLELVVMRMPDRKGNPGGIVVVPWTGEGLGEIDFHAGCLGTKLFALDVDGDGRDELITLQTGILEYLCLMKLR